MNKVAIIVVAYNRIDSLKQNLHTLNKGDYDDYRPDLIISLDKSVNHDEMIRAAEEFEWVFGKKIIRTFKERQGLRKHILQCGDLVVDYDAVIILEDDIIVAPGFYHFTQKCLDVYGSNPIVAGIALYTPQINAMDSKLFIPYKIDSDVFLIQGAQSWGQCWNKRMWNDFRKWYAENENQPIEDPDIPHKVKNWRETSWVKHFMRYLVREKKYFVYPYDSYATNSSPQGQHNKNSSHRFQVPMMNSVKTDYKFPKLDDLIKYDIFFERIFPGSAELLGISYDDICVDIYGIKTANEDKRYILTSKILNAKKIAGFQLGLRPHELNKRETNKKADFFLYDLGIGYHGALRIKRSRILASRYYVTADWKDAFFYFINGFFIAISYKLNSFKLKK